MHGYLCRLQNATTSTVAFSFGNLCDCRNEISVNNNGIGFPLHPSLILSVMSEMFFSILLMALSLLESWSAAFSINAFTSLASPQIRQSSCISTSACLQT